MLPIVLDSEHLAFALVGEGAYLERRHALLVAAGVSKLDVYCESASSALAGVQSRLPTAQDLDGVAVLFIAGLDRQKAVPLVAEARARGILVNTEDDRALCDFHVPASVRRGDLLLTVSTGGASPGLARRLRQSLEAQFDEQWAGNVSALAAARQAWRDEGLDFKTVARKSDDYIDRKGWLK